MSQDAMPDKPVIEYPCVWEYRIIGMDGQRMRLAVAQVVGDIPYTLNPSHVSTGGKYVSQSVSLTVRDEAQRVGLFEALRGHPDIRMVL